MDTAFATTPEDTKHAVECNDAIVPIDIGSKWSRWEQETVLSKSIPKFRGTGMHGHRGSGQQAYTAKGHS